MRPRFALALLWTFVVAAPLSAQPTVVQTNPPDGAENVVGPIITIDVKFSEAMKTDSWSLVAPDTGRVPEVEGEPWFSDAQTCHLKVKVEPGQQYGLGFNSETRKGFVSADGQRPLRPYVLHFRTRLAGAEAGEGQPLVLTDTWREGETQERILTIERTFQYTIAGGQKAEFYEKTVATVALQVLAVADGRYTHVRSKIIAVEASETNPDTGQVEALEEPVPGIVLEAKLGEGGWQASAVGGEVPAEVLDAFVKMLEVGTAFAPRAAVRVGEAWQLEGEVFELAANLPGCENARGTITCKLAETGEIQGHPSAKITHTWEVEFQCYDLTMRGVGQGTTTYLLDAHKFISNSHELDLTVPRQQTPDGQTITGAGKQMVTQRLRYFPKGQYEELKPTPTPEGGAVAPGGAQGMTTFSHPQGVYTVSYSARWQRQERLGQGRECVLLVSPSQKAQAWIWNMPSAAGTLEDFYAAVFEQPIRGEWGDDVKFDKPYTKQQQGRTWLYGKAAAEGQFMQSCSMTEAGGQFVGVTLVAIAGIPADEFDELNAVLDGFSPGAAPHGLAPGGGDVGGPGTAPGPAAQPAGGQPAQQPPAAPPEQVAQQPTAAPTGGEFRPALPLPQAAGGHIVFSRYLTTTASGGGLTQDVTLPKLYLMNPDGSENRPFLAPAGYVSVKQARWSPNYDRLAFTSDYMTTLSACMEDIFVAAADGSWLRRITGNEMRGAPDRGFGALKGMIVDNTREHDSATWKGAETICVTAQGADGRVYHPKGPEVADVTNKETGQVMSKVRVYRFTIPKVAAGRKTWVKVWSGKYVGNLVFADVQPNQMNDMGNFDLSKGNYLAWWPSLTPDGRYVVGVGSIASVTRGESPIVSGQKTEVVGGADNICVYDLATGTVVGMFEATRAQGELAKDPAVSPDGRWIAVCWGRACTENLALIALDDLLANRPNPRVLVPGQMQLAQAMYGAACPAWSPDGRMIAFSRTVMTTQMVTAQICVVNADGSEPRQLTNFGQNQICCQPCFSPDGKQVACTVLTGKFGVIKPEHLATYQFTADIYAVNVDGSGVRQLTNDGISCEAAWGP